MRLTHRHAEAILSLTPEGQISAYLKRRLESIGAEWRKCSWEGRAGAPDLFIMYHGKHLFVETKAPGERPRKLQQIEFEIMRQYGGCIVLVISSKDEVDTFINALMLEDIIYDKNSQHRRSNNH